MTPKLSGYLEQQISEQLAAHPDNQIFIRRPRAGTVRATRLLAEIGGLPRPLPHPDSLACLAGVAPSTRASGKSRHVGFRWAGDKQLCDAVCYFAGDSRRANPWAQDLYPPARDCGHDHPHAVRSLARGSTSAGTAGRPASPTSPPGTAPGNACSPAWHRLRRPE